MKNYVTQILVLVGVLIVVYLLWGADIKIFLKDRGVVDIPTFLKFVYGLGLWLVEKVLSVASYIFRNILQLFDNILSSVTKIADLLTGVLDVFNKIASFVKNL